MPIKGDPRFDRAALLKVMAEKRIIQARLAEMVGCPRAQISTYITGRSLPRMRRIQEMADALGCKVEVLLQNPTREKKDPSQIQLTETEHKLTDLVNQLPPEMVRELARKFVQDLIEAEGKRHGH